MASECVDSVLKYRGAPVSVYRGIVYNKHVVDDFERRGVTVVNAIEEVPAGATVVYSAHGVSPEIRSTSKRRDLIEIDATCPLVTKVHAEGKGVARKGDTIIFIGDKEHGEAVGAVGGGAGLDHRGGAGGEAVRVRDGWGFSAGAVGGDADRASEAGLWRGS